MIASNRWEALLTLPMPGHHIAQVYHDPDFLTDAVCRYICAGLQQNDAIIVLTTRSRWSEFSDHLERDGFSVQNAVRRNQLLLLDTDRILGDLLKDGISKWEPFKNQIETTFSRIPPRYSSVRAYGDLCDTLRIKACYDGASMVEQLWNEMVQEKSLSIFCSYFIDHLDPSIYDGQLQGICKCHSHLISSSDHDKFAVAVSEANDEILGPSTASMLRSLAQKHRSNTQMSSDQATLFYMGEYMPVTATKVMARIREKMLGL